MEETNLILIDDERQKTEDKILQKLKDMGFESPLDSAENGRMAIIAADSKWRRWIVEERKIRLSDCEESQVRKKVVDTEYVKTNLAPRIERSGQKVPVIVEQSHIPGRFKIITGHHRLEAGELLDIDIQAVVVSRPIGLDPTQPDPTADKISKIQANMAPHGKGYTIDDAVVSISEMFSHDPTLGGRNPGEEIPPRSSTPEVDFSFDDLMDWVYAPTEHFLHKSTRTKIRNKLLKGDKRHKIVDMSQPAQQTAFLSRLKWDPGLSKNNKRVSVDKHFDSKRNSMIALTDSNGKHINEKFTTLLEKILDEDDAYRKILKNNGIKYLDVAVRIYNPPTDKAGLDNERDLVRKTILKWKNIFGQIPNFSLELRMLAFPKQLRSGSDKDIMEDIRNL